MWLICIFDLPVDTKAARKAYSLFRKALIADGFVMMQYSVYARCCLSEELVAKHTRRVQQQVPDAGEVRTFTMTDKQYAAQRIFEGKTRRAPERAARQLEFF